ncbi:MAG: hypothetical protein AAF907_08020, partial [Planctomycetota bacterium]
TPETQIIAALPTPGVEEPDVSEDDPKENTANANIPAAVARPAPPPRFLVSGGDAGPRGFSSLDAAIEDASTGEAIAVNVDGPLDIVLKQAIDLTGKALTLRAGKKSDGTRYAPQLKAFATYNVPQELFHLTGAAELTLEDLSLTFDLPTSQPSGWRMFSLGAGDRLTMRDCTLTLLGTEERAETNAMLLLRGYRLPASSLEELADPDRKDRAADGEFFVTAERCLLRGQSDLARVEPERAGAVELIDSAVSMQASVLRMSGADAERPPPESEADRVHFTLQRSTLLFGQSLIDVRWKAVLDERPPLPLTVFATDSLYVDAAGEAVLIRTRGGDDQQTFLERLQWTGAGVNQYLLDRFWIASGTTTTIENPGEKFEDWLSLAETSGSPVIDMNAQYRSVELPEDYRARFPNQISRQDVQPRPLQPAAAETAANRATEPPATRSPAVPPAVFEAPAPGVDASRLPPPDPPIRTASGV